MTLPSVGMDHNQTKSELTPSFHLQFIASMSLTNQDLPQVTRDRLKVEESHPSPSCPASDLNSLPVVGTLGSLQLGSRPDCQGSTPLHPIQQFLPPSFGIRIRDSHHRPGSPATLHMVVDCGIECLRRRLLAHATAYAPPVRQCMETGLGSSFGDSGGQLHLHFNIL